MQYSLIAARPIKMTMAVLLIIQNRNLEKELLITCIIYCQYHRIYPYIGKGKVGETTSEGWYKQI
jgi:hypothetical protein